MAQINFNAADHEPNDRPDPLPNGWYASMIAEAELVPSKSADAGDMLKLTFVVDENEHPEYANRRVWVSLCIHHSSEVARKIARGTLSSICRAIDIAVLDDTNDLLGQQLRIKVGTEKPREGYDPRNTVNGAKSMAEAPPAKPPVPVTRPTASRPAAAPAAANAAPKKKGW